MTIFECDGEDAEEKKFDEKDFLFLVDDDLFLQGDAMENMRYPEVEFRSTYTQARVQHAIHGGTCQGKPIIPTSMSQLLCNGRRMPWH